jgi:hypothetical protein
MRRLRPPVEFADAVGPLRTVRLDHVWRAALRCWAVLAAGALLASLAWRAAGNAPPLLPALHGSSVALWLAALWLAPAMERTLAGQTRYAGREALPPPTAGRFLLVAAAYAVVVASAPLSLLLAYAGATEVARLATADGAELRLPLAAFTLAVLLCAGPALLLLSWSLLLHARRSLGAGLGTLAWVAVTAALHLLTAPAAPFAQALLERGSPADATLALTAGGYGSWALQALARLASDPSSSAYLHEVAEQILAPALALWVVAGALFALALRRAQRTAQAILPGWVVPAAAVWCAALKAAADTLAWSGDMRLHAPGDWRGTLALGLAVLLAGRWLLAWGDGRSTSWRTLLAELGWMWWALIALLCLTMPGRLAGQMYREEVLYAGGALLVVLTALALLLHRLAQLRQFVSPFAGAALLVIALPLLVLPLAGPGHAAPAALVYTLSAALAAPDQAPYAGCALGSLALMCLALWPWPRGQRKTPLAAAAAPPAA